MNNNQTSCLLHIAIALIFGSCSINHALVRGEPESVKSAEIYFLPLNSTSRIYTGISDLKKEGYILINRNSDMLIPTITELQSLRESKINIDSMDFQMLLIFHFSNGRKDEVAFDSKSRIYINGTTCKKNPAIVKALVNCLPMQFREVWIEWKRPEF